MKLPPGWAQTTIGEVTEAKVIQAAPAASFTYIDIGSIDNHAKAIGECRKMSAKDAPSRARQQVQPGDVLVSMTRPNLNAVAIVPESLGACVASTGFDVLRGQAALPEWLFAYVRTDEFVQRMSRLVQGALYPAVRPTDIRSTPLPLPPLNEQRRIVAKLEALQTRSRRAREALDAVPPLLEKLRQSILAAAFRGDLTKDWRAKHKDVEPASKLLERIRVERRKKWEEAELAKMKAKGKTPKHDQWKAKYKEPEPVDSTVLPALPEGWCWASVEAFAFVTKLAGFEYTKFVTYDSAGDLPVVKAENVSKQGFVRTEFSRVHASSVEKLTRSRLRAEDVLMVFVGAGLGQVGRVPTGERFFLGPNVALIRCDPSGVNSAFVEGFLRSPFGFALSRGESKATAQGSISMEQIRGVPVAIAPSAEQDAVLAKLELLLPSLRVFELRQREHAKAMGELGRAILTRAFRGELVPQDPNDELADVKLLSRARDANGMSADGEPR